MRLTHSERHRGFPEKRAQYTTIWKKDQSIWITLRTSEKVPVIEHQ